MRYEEKIDIASRDRMDGDNRKLAKTMFHLQNYNIRRQICDRSHDSSKTYYFYYKKIFRSNLSRSKFRPVLTNISISLFVDNADISGETRLNDT